MMVVPHPTQKLLCAAKALLHGACPGSYEYFARQLVRRAVEMVSPAAHAPRYPGRQYRVYLAGGVRTPHPDKQQAITGLAAIENNYDDIAAVLDPATIDQALGAEDKACAALAMLSSAHLVLALMKQDAPSPGTLIEVGYAAAAGIPVVIVWDGGARTMFSIPGVSVVSTVEDGLAAVGDIARAVGEPPRDT